jgi:hypothetical protein
MLHAAAPTHAVTTARQTLQHVQLRGATPSAPCDMPLQAEGTQAAAHVARRRVVARQLFAVLMLAVLALLLAILPGGSPSRTDDGGRATPFSSRKARRTMPHTRIAHTLHSAPQHPPQARPPTS